MSAAQWKRPFRVDLVCDLRVIGWGNESFRFESDEGDGYDFEPMHYLDGEGPQIMAHHYEEWAEQLENCIEVLRKKAALLKGVKLSEEDPVKIRNRFQILKEAK